MGIGDVFHHFHVKFPSLLLGPMSTIGGMSEVLAGMIVLESFCQGQCSFFVLGQSQDSHSISARFTNRLLRCYSRLDLVCG